MGLGRMGDIRPIESWRSVSPYSLVWPASTLGETQTLGANTITAPLALDRPYGILTSAMPSHRGMAASRSGVSGGRAKPHEVSLLYAL